MKHFYGELTERNGEVEYQFKFLFVADPETDPKGFDAMEKVWMNFYFDGKEIEENDWWFDSSKDAYWINGERIIYISEHREIPEGDYDVLKKYLNDLTFA
jgi:hypothetical protein